MRWAAIVSAVPSVALTIGLVFLPGCATTPAATNQANGVIVGSALINPTDPWESWNRKVFSFNDTVDKFVLKPVAKAYVAVVPKPVRSGVNNFYGNVSDAWSAVNNMLQGKFSNGVQDVLRVSTNTLFGLVGLFDVASDLGLEKQGEDFGQTLGVWGLGTGPYMVLPLLGPSSLRDTSALPLDRLISPSLAFSGRAAYSLTGLGAVKERANLLDATQLLDQMALDRYSFVRDAYLQRRRSLVYDGNAPEPKEDTFVPDAEPAVVTPAVPGASEPK
jgi:phospholipid-binding lipoprotein MlaA